MFLGSANREIVKASLGFVKVAVVSFDPSLVTPSLPSLVPALVNWSHEHSNHFKVKIRHLLERMIRKYGYDAIERYVPEDDKKLVTSIRKRQNRLKKKKAAAMDAEGGSDDDEVRPGGRCRSRTMPQVRIETDRLTLSRPLDRKPVSSRRTTRSCTGPTRTSRSTRMPSRSSSSQQARPRTASRRRGRTTGGIRTARRTFKRARMKCLTCSTTA